jgi:hypothetical protein
MQCQTAYQVVKVMAYTYKQLPLPENLSQASPIFLEKQS